MSTAAKMRAVQDHVLAEGHAATTVAVYGALVTTLAELCGESDADSSAFPADAVLQAAMREADEETRARMGTWLAANWPWVCDSAAVLDALDEVPDALLPIPTGAFAYRSAAEDLALRAGETCAAVAWVGAAATIEFTRLYTDREAEVAELMARDSVVAAAFRELPVKELWRVRDWVRDHWIAIDTLATERAA